MLDSIELNNLREKVRSERDSIIFKSKELTKLISERDSSIEEFQSKQFMFENIVSSKNNSVIDSYNTEKVHKYQKLNSSSSLTPNTINLKFNTKNRLKP